MDPNKFILTPRRPYVLRALYDWLIDNDLTPHVVVDATLPSVKVPLEFVQDGQIVLNIAPRAVGNLSLGNDYLTFQARFGGQPHSVSVPIYAVQAIYARENGAGTMFETEDAYLKEIESIEARDAEEKKDERSFSPEVISTDSIEGAREDGSPDDEPPRPGKAKPSLKIVK